MLTQLTIKNFTLIDQLCMDFSQGLNILTGETGAGKSIVLDALRFVLGERLESSQVRDPQKPLLVEALFELPGQYWKAHPLFQDFLIDGETNLIINRQYLPDNRTKIKINGQNVTVGQLKELGNHLIDFHGPHDHQMLFSEEEHLKILDRLINFDGLQDEYTKSFQEYSKLKSELAALINLSQTRQRDIDLLKHQLNELSQVPLDENKFADLQQEQVKINNAEKLFGHVQQLLTIFQEEESNVIERLRQAFSPLRSLVQIDEKLNPLLQKLELIQEQSQELASELSHYAESLSFDSDKAAEIIRRYDIYTDIKRKYGPTLEDAQKFYLEIKDKHDLITNFAHNDAELREKIRAKEKDLTQKARKITQKRETASESLKKTIEKELQELGIHNVQFKVQIQKVDFNETGCDQISFFISPNKGEALRPLAQIVSSGEAARVMLALKKALIKVDPVPVLVFDEIDAQIGGRLGTITGKKLKELSQNRQVLLITHLPQIASFADKHFKVTKTIKSGRTLTTIESLDKQARIKELAQMMSGNQETKLSLSHAQDMLTQANCTN